MAEVEEIMHKLNQQDRILEDISKLLKGSVSLNLQGIIPMINDMKQSMVQVVSDVADLQRWKKQEQESKGTFTIRTSVMITRILAVIGAVGIIVGAILGGLQAYEVYQNLQNKQNTEQREGDSAE